MSILLSVQSEFEAQMVPPLTAILTLPYPDF